MFEKLKIEMEVKDQQWCSEWYLLLEEDNRLVADVSLSVVVRSPELLSPDLTVVTAPRGLLYHQDQAGGSLHLHHHRHLLNLERAM